MTTTTQKPLVKRQYLRRLQSRILRHAMYRGGVHADDVLVDFPVPDGIHPNIVGTAFSGLEAAGLIEVTGFERSNRKVRHRGISRLWRVCDASGARKYLKALASSGDDYGQ